MRIGFFGIEGSYTYFAAKRYFAQEEIELVACKTFAQVFQAVTERKCDYGVIPIENSLAGSVVENFDNLLRYEVNIVGETYLRIEHCLLGKEGVGSQGSDSQMFGIKRVFGHPQALAQCGGLFERFANIEAVPWGDNASAVKYVAELNGDNSVAAIGSRDLGEMYGLKVLAEGIADSDMNMTRFLVISARELSEGFIGQVYDHRHPGVMKVSVYFTVTHEPGSLVRVLAQFEEIGLNLTKIESRPIKGKAFEYGFFVDAVGDVSRVDLKERVRDVVEIRVLGEYVEI